MTRPFALAVLLTAVPAQAARETTSEPNVDLQLFHPAAGANNFFSTESGDVNTSLDLSVGLTLGWAHNPLAVELVDPADPNSVTPVGAVVKDRFDATLLLAIGLFNLAELGVAMPAIMQSGFEKGKFTDIAGGVNVGIESLPSFTPGDVRVIPKVRVLHMGGGAFSVAIVGTVVIPVNKQPYAGERNIVYAPSLAMSFKARFLRFGLNGGYRVRDPGLRIAPVPDAVLLIVDDEIFAKAAIAFDVNMGAGTPFEVIGEVYGHGPANDPLALSASGLQRDRRLSRVAVEGVLGLRMILAERFIFTAGGGGGLAPHGYGQAVPRIFAGLSYYTGQFGLADADLDGVSDDLDKCPNKKEDRDGFEDHDGCPDIDNDADAVLDEDDQCPNEPEDKDGLGDDDGCPETDFDGDGILDEKDKCPRDAEDKDGVADDDGCPDLDNDGDGIADAVDKCPKEAEDIDNFQDSDGCPEPDNDGDGLPDLGDLCPNHAEDKDGVADDDGCPEDNDGDGIPDDLDKCPKQAEIYNGIEDDDGCPEKVKAKSLVRVTEDKIEIKEKVFFATNSAKILSRSHNLLDQVAAVLKNYKHIRKVRVEGHTDSRGPKKRNVQLSRERAQSVRQYLVDQGVEAARLEAEGYGPDKAIASNKTARGREQNRRVDFVIVDQAPIGKDVSEAEPKIDLEPSFELETPSAPAKPPSGEPSFELEFDAPPAAAPVEAPKGKGKAKPKKEEKPGEIQFDF